MSEPGNMAHDAFMAACVALGMHESPHQWQHKPAKMRAAWAAVEAAIRADERHRTAIAIASAIRGGREQPHQATPPADKPAIDPQWEEELRAVARGDWG